MRIATWNVNSVRARLQNVIAWLNEAKPDILLMQEIKCETESFPVMEFRMAGYGVRTLGQKSYNGVAIASLHPIEDVAEGLPDLSEPSQCRYMEATISGIRVASVYAPNGNPVGTEKFNYKLQWMRRLKARAAELFETEEPVVLGGDFNVIPTELDVYDPKGWERDALFDPRTRAAYREILALGYTETFRALYPDRRAYTFWDYQNGAWAQDRGLRLDHFLLSPEACDRVADCLIDKDARGKDKASDHAPVIVELAE
ncbi:MAG: exodeoxyribonuclease III [Alphaproteobacteria bacterium]|nr:exodeoxyribonuclease III [Alphaproteobacteria bacterium]